MAPRCGAKHICTSKSTKHLRAEPFWTLRSGKMARRCGAKHICKQNVQNTSWSEPFWTLRSGKMERRCGAKHICQSKCTNHLMLGAVFEVAIWKSGTPLWREAHLVSQNGQNTSCSEPFLKFRSGKVARRCGAKHI